MDEKSSISPQVQSDQEIKNQSTLMTSPGIVPYTIALIALFVFLVGGVFLYSYVTTQQNIKPVTTQTTQNAAEQPTGTPSNTVESLSQTDAQKPANQAAAQQEINKMQSVMDNNVQTESSDYATVNSDLQNTNQGTSEQSSLTSL